MAGCLAPNGHMEGGVLSGTVLFAGRPAQGKVVTLERQMDGRISTVAGSDGRDRSEATNASGFFRFSGLEPGDYRVTFVSAPVPDGKGLMLAPGLVGSWTSAMRAVSKSFGATLPAFDIEYNGPIYPADSGGSYLLSKSLPVPFHWSTHRQGRKYLLKLFAGPSAGGANLVRSEWTGHPTTLVAQDVVPGIYSWTVTIEGGDAGKGASWPRLIYLRPPGSD